MNLVCQGAGKVMNLETLLGDDAAILDALFAYVRQCDLLDKL